MYIQYIANTYFDDTYYTDTFLSNSNRFLSQLFSLEFSKPSRLKRLLHEPKSRLLWSIKSTRDLN